MRKAEQNLNLSHLCQLFDVPVSSYYYQSVHKPNDAAYRDKLTVIHNENFQAYGRRRMKVALADNGINLGVFKIARLMKQTGIIAKVPKKMHYYPSGKQKPNIPNELKRQFNPPQVNTHWVGDITYIRHHQGLSYLATVLYLGSREIVGYALLQTPDAQLARQALMQAVKIQQLKTSHLMFHSDQGVQYSANLFKQTLSLHRIVNDIVESFFGSLKQERVHWRNYQTRNEAQQDILNYISVFYTNFRLHSTLGYISPNQYEMQLEEIKKAA